MLVIGNGCVLVGMGERTRPAARRAAGRPAVRRRRRAARDRARPARAPLRDAPRHRHDDGRPGRLHDLPGRPRGPDRYELRPGAHGTTAERADDAFASIAAALDVPELRLFETGGDRFEAEREQWDDGNNVLAVAPGVVVAYERNVATNTRCAATASRSSPSPASSSAAAAAVRAACPARSSATPSENGASA